MTEQMFYAAYRNFIPICKKLSAIEKIKEKLFGGFGLGKYTVQFQGIDLGWCDYSDVSIAVRNENGILFNLGDLTKRQKDFIKKNTVVNCVFTTNEEATQ